MAKVLVVDDDPSIRGLIVSVLARERLAVDVAAGGEEGLRKVRETDYAVVVLDLMMPNFSGFDILKALEETGRPASCVVVVSAGAQKVLDNIESPLVRARLRKPFDISELVASVRRCLARSS